MIAGNRMIWMGLLCASMAWNLRGVADEAAGQKSPDAAAQASTPKAELPAPPAAIQRRLLQLHNEARQRQGLTPLRPHPRLMAAAQRFAEYMHRTGRFSHYGDGRSPGDRVAAEGYQQTSWAENIAWSQSSPEAAMNTWLNSGGHRGNILSGHRQVGFGNVGTIWVTVFANSADDAG